MKYLKPILAACFGVFIATNAQAQFNKVFPISQPDDHQPAEVSIAINPTNPQNMVAAFITRQKEFPGIDNNSYVTMDGGKTWKKVHTINPMNRVQGDDGLDFSSNGIVYHSYLSFYGIFGGKKAFPSTGIYMSASFNGGETWPRRTRVVEHLNTPDPMEDKPYVEVDNSPDSPYKGNVYTAWTHFAKYASKNPADSSQIYFTRSTDSIKTFSPYLRISDHGGNCLDNSRTVEGAMTAVGPKGQVYVVWAGPRGLVFTKSLDGGKSFSRNKVIGYISGGWDFAMPGINRTNGMPVTKVDLSHSDYRGSIYVNWVDNRNGDHDVFLKYSRDGGKTWSNPVRVNDDKVGNGKQQFLTWMAVDSKDGSVNIVYYDRSGLDSTMTAVDLARSVDGGKTFKNYRINQKPFDCNSKIFFGDYTGIDAYDGLVVPAFMHFKDKKHLAISAAIFRFKPGTLKKARN
ncbi:MAG TPA: sialidase family protein [Balneolales bacterium]|nr:sialidase family protein [Balneolales bacterium]